MSRRWRRASERLRRPPPPEPRDPEDFGMHVHYFGCGHGLPLEVLVKFFDEHQSGVGEEAGHDR